MSLFLSQSMRTSCERYANVMRTLCERYANVMQTLCERYANVTGTFSGHSWKLINRTCHVLRTLLDMLTYMYL